MCPLALRKPQTESLPSCLAVWVGFITLKLGFICWLHPQTSWLLITSADQIFKGLSEELGFMRSRGNPLGGGSAHGSRIVGKSFCL